jgi:hypothetical protein
MEVIKIHQCKDVLQHIEVRSEKDKRESPHSLTHREKERERERNSKCLKLI